jgi:hypothetical protein
MISIARVALGCEKGVGKIKIRRADVAGTGTMLAKLEYQNYATGQPA